MRKLATRSLFAAVLAAVAFSSALGQEYDPKNRAYKTDVTRTGTAAGTMLEIGIGARAQAMGGAFVAIANDPSALYWNPAGITEIAGPAIQMSKIDWFVGTTLGNVDVTVPLPMSMALGFHVAIMDYGEQPVRTVFRPEGTGERYSAKDLVAGIYWAYAITDRISTSVGLKYFYERIWHTSGSTGAVDLSILYKTGLKGLSLGGTISNLGPEFRLDGRDLTRVMDADGRKDVYFNNEQVPVRLKTDKYPLPLLFRFGLAYTMDFGPQNSLTIATNLNHPSDMTESVDLGAEAKLMNIAYLRAGYQGLFEEGSIRGLTLGAGLRYKILGTAIVTIDYAWSDWSILTSVNRFSIGISSYY